MSGSELAHNGIERRLALKPYAGPLGERQIAVFQFGIVGKSPEGPEYAGIGFGPAQAEAGGNSERHLIAAMGQQGPARPSVALEHGDRARILYDAIGVPP